MLGKKVFSDSNYYNLLIANKILQNLFRFIPLSSSDTVVSVTLIFTLFVEYSQTLHYQWIFAYIVPSTQNVFLLLSNKTYS